MKKIGRNRFADALAIAWFTVSCVWLVKSSKWVHLMVVVKREKKRIENGPIILGSFYFQLCKPLEFNESGARADQVRRTLGQFRQLRCLTIPRVPVISRHS
ncbi:hypothetical protein F4781DRAFT_384323 [Annulohypoxylon bovei var. microspora]|nr:hypothetical protein F4781DRAFT_384323 [Annulohypoxylon bovei var. microspora]